MPVSLPVRLLLSAAFAAGSGGEPRHCEGGADDACVASSPPSLTAGSLLLQQASKVRHELLLETEGSCAPFKDWPHVDKGVTCASCTALVLTGPYGGRCDRYCESFGHVCVAAAEERAEGCEVQQARQCSEEIGGTSDMLCTCERQGQSPAPAPASGTPPSGGACFGSLPGLATDEGNAVGSVQVYTEEACKSSCVGDARCNSASLCPQWGCFLKDRSFSGGEPTRSFGGCSTLFKTSCS
eukprot:CAMPEP_0175658898 /NCGR_PEP_ID=MMETSP0097-20121207/13658_1 /TAXON_ID=311494 /ORGANISM="Alexandrium monilatum, Strain CCMP3105" /LENGTH=239 /DNA_ID=CAMNT_0016965009 /DNA_START=29 /DNA_END=744 /DNA_ORIENTATION=+